MFGINLNSVLPIRVTAQEQSEMCSQLLFGEHAEIIEKQEKFYCIKSCVDGYCGWVDRKSLTLITDETAQALSAKKWGRINKPIAHCFIEARTENILLPGGSIVPFYDEEEECFEIEHKVYRIAREEVNLPNTKAVTGDQLLTVAFKYLNSPYLWGGKNALGIDCSGFIQVLMNVMGIEFPRDSNQQVNEGKVINFLTEAQSGDIAFFENAEGKIVHVGMLINNNQIIHASGRVKIETIDAQGIKAEDGGKYTHQLRVIKRVI